jgi:hypothetical protein
VAWRWRSWRSRRSRRCRCLCSGPAPSPDADGLLSSPRRRLKSSSLACRRRPGRCVRTFPRLDAAATRLLPLPHGVASGVGRKTPMGLVVGALGLRPHPAFESRGRGRQGESPNLPRARPAGLPRRSRLPSRRTGCRGAMRRGQKRDSRPEPGWVRAHARTGPSPCGPAERGARPIPRARLRRGSPGASHPMRGEDKVGEEGGKVAVDAWALPARE